MGKETKDMLFYKIESLEKEREKILEEMDRSLFESVSKILQVKIDAINSTLESMFLKYKTLYKD